MDATQDPLMAISSSAILLASRIGESRHILQVRNRFYSLGVLDGASGWSCNGCCGVMYSTVGIRHREMLLRLPEEAMNQARKGRGWKTESVNYEAYLCL